MAYFFADSSVLVKRHVREMGTAWFQMLAASTNNNIIIIAQISIVEVCSALNRRIREASLDRIGYAQVVTDFDALCAAEYQVIELLMPIINHTRGLLERHPLRAYDAVQLASASIANDALAVAGLPALTFLSADQRLLNAAQVEGFAIDDPNAHP
jgi:predicted nucleic acid-binding protein